MAGDLFPTILCLSEFFLGPFSGICVDCFRNWNNPFVGIKERRLKIVKGIKPAAVSVAGLFFLKNRQRGGFLVE